MCRSCVCSALSAQPSGVRARRLRHALIALAFESCAVTTITIQLTGYSNDESESTELIVAVTHYV